MDAERADPETAKGLAFYVKILTSYERHISIFDIEINLTSMNSIKTL